MVFACGAMKQSRAICGYHGWAMRRAAARFTQEIFWHGPGPAFRNREFAIMVGARRGQSRRPEGRSRIISCGSRHAGLNREKSFIKASGENRIVLAAVARRCTVDLAKRPSNDADAEDLSPLERPAGFIGQPKGTGDSAPLHGPKSAAISQPLPRDRCIMRLHTCRPLHHTVLSRFILVINVFFRSRSFCSSLGRYTSCFFQRLALISPAYLPILSPDSLPATIPLGPNAWISVSKRSRDPFCSPYLRLRVRVVSNSPDLRSVTLRDRGPVCRSYLETCFALNTIVYDLE